MFNHKANRERPKHDTKLSSTYTTYQDALDLTRDEMNEELGWFYERVVRGLKEVLSAERVEFLPGKVGLPGFHIIPSHLAWTFPVFRFHSDEKFDLIVDYVLGVKGGEGLNPGTCVGESRISFTLPIAMPDERSGLNYVDFSTDERGTDCRRDAEKVYGREGNWKCHWKTRELYREGVMVVHSGTLLHSIGEWSYTGHDRNRVTMQGFGFKCKQGGEDVWYIYW
ncbi:hypothetical protein TrRE_jg2304 [Triparma retinervis]|uniref:Uncharacterized protein n=1 Tax=Triparma retinervis TaxID=2557542 RepID=A0A9W6ZSB2_9STRA|nr:hypothetical protein TrRE_jg2304 [Triparma retinervis]